MTSSKSLKRLVPSGDTTIKNKGRKDKIWNFWKMF